MQPTTAAAPVFNVVRCSFERKLRLVVTTNVYTNPKPNAADDTWRPLHPAFSGT